MNTKAKLHKRPAIRAQAGAIFRRYREAIVEMIFSSTNAEMRTPRPSIPVELMATRWPIEPR